MELSNKHYTCRDIDSKVANEFIKKFHYSHKVVSNSKLHLGLFRGETLCGVLSFGYPVNAKKTPNIIVAGSTYNDMYELNRMAMHDDEPKFSESKAIGLCMKWIKRFHPHILYILSYSDGKEGNIGTIYQATGWDYLGYMISDSFWELDDIVLHNVQVWHKFKEGKPDTTETKEVIKYFENVSKIVSRQYIYVMPLKKVTYTRAIQKYPKKETEVMIESRIIYKENGITFDKPKRVHYC